MTFQLFQPVWVLTERLLYPVDLVLVFQYNGQSQAVTDLATRIRTVAARQGIGKVRVMLPDLEWLRDAFRTAGYGPGDWEGELWIFERQLYQEGEGTHDR